MATEFIAFYDRKKVSIKADSLYAAKQQAISQLKIPKSKQGLLAVMSKKAYDDQQFKYEQLERQIRMMIKEEIQRLTEKTYMTKAEMLTDYLNDSITFNQLSDLVGGDTSRIASKQELTGFLKNKFLIDLQAETYGISSQQLVKKVKELLKQL